MTRSAASKTAPNTPQKHVLLVLRLLLFVSLQEFPVRPICVYGFSPHNNLPAVKRLQSLGSLKSNNYLAPFVAFSPPPPTTTTSSSCLHVVKSKQDMQLHDTGGASSVGPRLAIREDFPGLEQIHSDPDIFVISNFLDDASCHDMVKQATQKGLQQSPVAYAGWTEDFKDLVELAAKGPVAWLAIGLGWLQTKDIPGASNVDLVLHMVQNFVVVMVLAIIGIGLFTKARGDQLQDLRTSTSTTLDNLMQGKGPVTFVRRTAELFTAVDTNSKTNQQALQEEASHFEAPTVIRYESGQVLAPHYDANRSAATEDANRGGQTLATLLVYLNDVPSGGLTRFGKLTPSDSARKTCTHIDATEQNLSIRPKRGDALLFFPADANGNFDGRTEHEGCPAVDEKFIARIWRHQNRVPPPFGLSEETLQQV